MINVWLTDEEQARLHRLAVDAANADLDDVARASAVVRAFLRDLRRKYGDLPGLLDIEACYVSEMSEAEQLLLAGYTAAERASDHRNCLLLATSLAAFYLDDRSDLRRAREWVVVATNHIVGAPTDDMENLARLRAAIERQTTDPDPS